MCVTYIYISISESAEKRHNSADMDNLAVICTLCLALATSAAVPHGNRGLKQAATKVLAWTEERAGAIFSEVLLGKGGFSVCTCASTVPKDDFATE